MNTVVLLGAGASAEAGIPLTRDLTDDVVAKAVEAKVVGVVGRTGGYTAQVADACVLIPTVNPDHVTPHTESFHSVVGHMLVSHPKLKAVQTKWESTVAS